MPRPAGAGRIRVLLVDDRRLVREALRKVIDDQPDMTVVGEAGDGPEAVDAARTLRPDVVLMDMGSPGTNGVETTRHIYAHDPSVTIVGLNVREDETGWQALRDAGAAAYMSMGEPFETLRTTIRSAVQANGATTAAGSAAAARPLSR
jgi:DNA-binding NarL/FixJ family response regulator